MKNNPYLVWRFIVGLLAAVSGAGQVLWHEPPRTTAEDWIWGPGGRDSAPQPPFKFVKERLSGTNPKVEVKDANGRRWIVKFGSEVHADTFAPRLLSALGYAAVPTFFVKGSAIEGTHDLKRAKHFVSKDGTFRSARFKLHSKQSSEGDADSRTWSWIENPFVGSHELGGLKILIMLTSNWDTKDARDRAGSNNEIIGLGSPANSANWYAVTDWGASFGKSGGFFKRSRWDWNAYRSQTSTFVRLTKDGSLNWGFKGKHGGDIPAGVRLEDIRWLIPYLSRITDDDLLAGLSASGASYPVAQDYTRSIRARIAQLQRIAGNSVAQSR